jgi:hypothetical protein
MRTLIPTSDDELNEEFFAAWFASWSSAHDDADPADEYAAYCAL